MYGKNSYEYHDILREPKDCIYIKKEMESWCKKLELWMGQYNRKRNSAKGSDNHN